MKDILKEQAALRDALRKAKAQAAEEKQSKKGKGRGRGKGKGKKRNAPEKEEEGPIGLDDKLESKDEEMKRERDLEAETERQPKRAKASKANAGSSRDKKNKAQNEETPNGEPSKEEKRLRRHPRTLKSPVRIQRRKIKRFQPKESRRTRLFYFFLYYINENKHTFAGSRRSQTKASEESRGRLFLESHRPSSLTSGTGEEDEMPGGDYFAGGTGCQQHVQDCSR